MKLVYFSSPEAFTFWRHMGTHVPCGEAGKIAAEQLGRNPMKRHRVLFIAVLFCSGLAGAGIGQVSPWPAGKADYDRGKAALKTGILSYALESVRKAVELSPDYVEAIKAAVNLAKQLKQRMDPKFRTDSPTLTALRKFYTVNDALTPNSAIFQWALGMCDESQTEEVAERYFRKAISLDDGFVEAYQSLASTLAYRGDLAGAEEMLRKVVALSPLDPEALAGYALRVGESDPARYRQLTEEFLTRFQSNIAGADLLARMAAHEGDMAARIATLEKLKALYPPNESEVSEWYMRFLYDAYNRSNPTGALALAQEMTRLMPARSIAQREWLDFVQYAQALILARSLMERKSYSEAANVLGEVGPPYLVSPDPQALLQAEVAGASGKSSRAYEILVKAMAAQPSDVLRPVLMKYSSKPEALREEDIWTARLKKASKVKDFELAPLRNGQKGRLSEYRGRVVVLYFWHPDDRVSREELPYLQKMLQKYGPQGLTVITINTKPEEHAIATVLAGRFDFVALGAPDDAWAEDKYRVVRTPASILIDRQGRALFHPEFWGYDPRHTFELEVEAMLAYTPKNR
jgi:tetratricopeptide (TPR) repeat protein